MKLFSVCFQLESQNRSQRHLVNLMQFFPVCILEFSEQEATGLNNFSNYSYSFKTLIIFMKFKYISLTAGQSSDSEDLPVLDSSSKCTPVKHLNSSKPQKISRSPARVISPHIKDGEKDKHREKHHHQNSSPRVYKWSFQLSKIAVFFVWFFFSISTKIVKHKLS